MKKALTIGELLITMTIIGIIAMLVLPGLLKDYNNKIFTAKIKKVYGMMNDAVEQACIDNNVSYFNQTPYAANGQERKFLETYFKAAKKDNVAAFASSYRKIVDTTNTGSALSDLSSYGKIKLQSGESIACKRNLIGYYTCYVDTNSAAGPNIGGRDLFVLLIEPTTNKIRDTLFSSGTKCGETTDGSGCLIKLIKNNWKMNY